MSIQEFVEIRDPGVKGIHHIALIDPRKPQDWLHEQFVVAPVKSPIGKPELV
jgi:hypothetical protein